MWLFVLVAFVLSPFGVLRAVSWVRRTALFTKPGVTTVAFFHPYCDSGGGGERVLWKAVEALQAWGESVAVTIYTGDSAPDADILRRAESRFNLERLRTPPRFVRLSLRRWVEAERYPVMTLLGQSFGSMVLGMEALLRFTPEVFVDTTGYAFTYPLASAIFGCRVACYTHYPTISSDMLQRVRERRPTYNNRSAVAQSTAASWFKVLYYRAFAQLYSLAGRFADVVMVNSNWTRGHIDGLWKVPQRTSVVFPPCDTRTLRRLPLEGPGHKGREPVILSLGQFRPEKDHPLQLEAFALFLKGEGRDGAQGAPGPGGDEGANTLPRLQAVRSKSTPALLHGYAKLVMVGGCRDAGDEARVAALKKQAEELGVSRSVEFRVNVPFSELQDCLGRSLVGIHTMWNEHFGIGVVEFMAAGAVTLAHNSGGPRTDIVVPFAGGPTGYLAATAQEYADALQTIFDLHAGASPELVEMRARARERAEEFSDEQFAQGFTRCVAAIVPGLGQQQPAGSGKPQAPPGNGGATVVDRDGPARRQPAAGSKS